MSFQAKHKHGQVLHIGTQQECELIANAFNNYLMYKDEIIITDITTKWMGDEVRKQVVELLIADVKDCMFGDGLESDYIRSGMTYIGLDNMSDDELLNEMEQFGYIYDTEEGADNDVVIKEVYAQKAIHEMLTT